MNIDLFDLPKDQEWWDSHDWVEFPIAVDVLETVKVILRPYGYSPEDACSLFLQRMVVRKDEILDKHRSGIPAEQLICELSDSIVKEIFDASRNPDMTKEDCLAINHHNCAVIQRIIEKYNLPPMDAARRFLTSKTYEMLEDPRNNLRASTDRIIFEMWEAEQVTGDPRKASAIRSE